MSRHHVKQKWSTHSPKLRKQLTPLLPLRCVECPHPVTAEMVWQVAHITDAMDDGSPTLDNVGVAHTMCPWCEKRCNQVAGGKRGAEVTNRGKRAEQKQDSYRGRRRWV